MENVKTAVHEPARETPVAEDCDICVVGGSCTGVFAAVRAARLGARVALVENAGFFGGVATAGLVNVWHSFYDTAGARRIIAGLTDEIAEALCARGAAVKNARTDESVYLRFNSAEMALALDELVAAHPRVRPFLHTRATAIAMDAPGALSAVIIEDAGGRRAIRARMFVDATGNGDLLHRAGAPLHHYAQRLPPTTCALYSGIGSARRAGADFSPERVIMDPQNPRALSGFLWGGPVPGIEDLEMIAGTRVNGADACDADALTSAEFEGRRQIRRSLELMNAHPAGAGVRLAALPARIGVRDTRHAHCLHRLTETEVLEGEAFADAIAHGSYRVDVHFDDRPGLVFRYLDGREDIANPPLPAVRGRWREERAVNPTHYSIPLRSLLPQGFSNLIVCGRAIDADRGAFGAARVMVNLNQTGEAAGVAAALALDSGLAPAALDAALVRAALRKGGSALLDG